MQKHSSLDAYIAACLFRSGLSPMQRAQAAEEIRAHLEERIAAHRTGGMNAADALGAAFAEFGTASRVRAAFRRRHLANDIRHGWAELCRHWWWPVAYASLSTLVPILLRPQPMLPNGQWNTNAQQTVIGMTLSAAMFFVLQLVLLSGVMAGAGAYEHRFRRSLPGSEFSFWHSAARWSLAVAAGLALLFALSLVTAIAIVPTLIPDMNCDRILVGWVESLSRTLMLTVLFAVASGLILASYQRCRCMAPPAADQA